MSDISNNMALYCGWFSTIALLIPIGIFIDIVANGHDSGVLSKVAKVAITGEHEGADGHKTVLYMCQDEEHSYRCRNDLCPDTLWSIDDDCSDVRLSKPGAALVKTAPFILAGFAVVWFLVVVYMATAYYRASREASREVARLAQLTYDPAKPNDIGGLGPGRKGADGNFIQKAFNA